MRDTFYCWITMMIFMSIFFGAAVARSAYGDVDAFGIACSVVGGIASALCASNHYRAAIAAVAQRREK